MKPTFTLLTTLLAALLLATPVTSCAAEPLRLENDKLVLCFDAASGTLNAVENKLTGETYSVSGDGTWTVNSSGTYSYSRVNRSSGLLQVNDSVSGASSLYVGFVGAWDGNYANTQPYPGGFQVGSFVMLDTTAPTVSITNPPTPQTYTSAQTVSIGASASDDMGVTRVEFYDGTTLKGTDTTAPYSYDWPFIAADNGPHVWTACAYDAAGNVCTSSPVALTVSIAITPPTLMISRQGPDAVLNWSTNAEGFALQWSTNLGALNWSNAIPAPAVVGGQYAVTNNMTNQARFYRLKK